MRRLTMGVLAGLAAMGFSAAAQAQSCVLCYTSAASSGPAAIHALHLGIISLLTPALGLFLAVFGLIIYRARVASGS